MTRPAIAPQNETADKKSTSEKRLQWTHSISQKQCIVTSSMEKVLCWVYRPDEGAKTHGCSIIPNRHFPMEARSCIKNAIMTAIPSAKAKRIVPAIVKPTVNADNVFPIIIIHESRFACERPLKHEFFDDGRSLPIGRSSFGFKCVIPLVSLLIGFPSINPLKKNLELLIFKCPQPAQ